ncbi:MAG TPA: CAP domain-containing protein [Candidatus Saccharimonadales bacterium]|nr:CAP domain-containing protein [Candidatus Saccharimonadales bacterium]
MKTYWPYLPLLAVVGLGLLLNSAWPKHTSVLGYATDMSIQSLLDDTNSQRSGNGQASLQLNGQLDAAAQAKANDMATRDYWSHNTPDGKTPWTFITSAGYSYQTAGENLAYGFDTAAATVTGWMNSPEHRANILNTTYKQVGFGIANAANYQGSGPETIVVAMYADPATVTVAKTTPVQTAPVHANASAPHTTPTVTHTTTAPTKVPAQTNTDTSKPKTTQPVSLEPAAQPVSRIQLLTGGQAPWSMFAVSLLISLTVVVFVIRHGLFWHRALVKSEQFVIHHPLFDVLIAAIGMFGYILSQASGFIR